VPAWSPELPRLHPIRLAVAWLASAAALLLAAGILPGAEIRGFGGAVVVAAIVGLLNALLPPVIAALRLPYTVAIGFLLVLALDAAILLLAEHIAPDELHVEGFGDALAVALIASAVSTALGSVAGIDDDDAYTLRVARRVARRVGRPVETDEPAILFLEIDGLALPVLRRAIRDGTTPNMARWLATGTHGLAGWETDLSSQTGASQAGILLGDNEDIPAFRWVDKASGRLVTCSNPDDCATIERARSSGAGLLVDGGTSRGNLLSGEAEAALLTVSRLADEKTANPGYRAFLANGSNVTRTFVLVLWEVCLELIAAARQRRRDVRPRGHRGGVYPLLRAGMCVFVRDLIVFSVLQDMFRGVPAVYATFASYDEVAHHSGLERPDTLEALRKLDQRFGMIDRARRYAPRPYELVVLSDHGQTQGATFRQRNGYGLDELVERSLSSGLVDAVDAGDENATGVGRAFDEATGRTAKSGEGGALRRRRAGGARRRRLAPVGGWRGDRHRSTRRLLTRRRASSAARRRLRARRRHHGQQLLRPRLGGGLRVRGAHLLPRGYGRSADPAVHPASCDAAGSRRAAPRRRVRAPAAVRLARASAPPGSGCGRPGSADRRSRDSHGDPLTRSTRCAAGWHGSGSQC
jgi:uncharacterized membrane protein YvlD (DUF360 family)